MKHFIVYLLSFVVTAAPSSDKLTGRWETKPSVKGNVTGIVFKEDNSFNGYINRKPFFTGTYALRDSLLSFVDNGCAGVGATYVVRFFSNSDSIRFAVVSDSCAERRGGMERIVLGRVKS